MRNYLFAFSILALLLVGATVFPKITGNQPEDKEEIVIETVYQFLKVNHYEPLDLDDEFSEQVFNTYIDYLDGSKRFFIQSEIEQLAVYKHQLDDQIQERSTSFLSLTNDLAESSMARAKRIFKEISKEEMDFTVQEQIELDRDKLDFAKDEEELKEVWRKLFKYDVLSRYYNKKTTQDKKKLAEEEDLEIKSDEELLSEAKEKVIKNLKDWFKQVEQIRRSDRFEYYVNSITHSFDPHSVYYTPRDKENFDLRFSGKLEGIGARLQYEDGFTKVSSIVPGGPAWKGKDLEVDDMILMVAQEGEEPVNVEGMRLDDVVDKIRGPKDTKVILTVKKKDGSIEEIEIIRDVIILEEGNAKSAIISKDDINKKIGYIDLPSFYADFADKNGRNSYRDIKNEIKKLKGDKVDGIILDLRYNGGGSLNDVVKIGGLFIEEGPVVQVKSRQKSKEVLRDIDKSVQYDGPLVIMVNESSASASEILAAAMQDYDRAIIVGSNSTFGKGTVQRFYDLDRHRFLSEYKPLGQVKFTMQKFFRVNGGSTQLKGVVPDIVLPDSYQYIKTGEKDYENAMEWDEIDPVDYSQNVYNISDKQRIIELSNLRVEKDEEFTLIEQKAKLLSDNKDDTVYPLDEVGYLTKRTEIKTLSEAFESIGKDSIPGIYVENLAVDMEYIQSDSSKIARNDAFLEQLYKDIYLEEALYIMNDLIGSNN